ncbi:MAG: hypothetical protein V4561_02965 [Bacteroidota bacterium]
MPTIPVIERNATIFDEIKTEPSNIGSLAYRQKVLDFHFINDFVNTDNAILGNAMIASFPDANLYTSIVILRSALEVVLANLDCDKNYIKIVFDEATHHSSYTIEHTENKDAVAEYRLNLFFSLLINYPNLISVEFNPGLCRYNISANPVYKVGVIKVNFSNGMASQYYDISIPPNEIYSL